MLTGLFADFTRMSFMNIYALRARVEADAGLYNYVGVYVTIGGGYIICDACSGYYVAPGVITGCIGYAVRPEWARIGAVYVVDAETGVVREDVDVIA